MSDEAPKAVAASIAEAAPTRGKPPPIKRDAQTDALLLLHPDLSRLLRAIRRSDPGHFALYFARCNNPSYRSRLVGAVKAVSTKPIAEISLDGLPLHEQTLDNALLQRIQEAPADAVLFIYDLETLLPHADERQQQRVLLQLNWRRSAFSRLKCTLVFWVPEFALQLLASQAPDFADWYSGIYEFEVPDEAKGEALRHSLQGFYDGDIHAADRLSAAEKRRWIETLHSLLEDQPAHQEESGLWTDLGRVYHSTAQNAAALAAYEKGLALAHGTQGRKLEGTLLNNISQIYDARGDYDKALEFLKQSLAIRQEIGDRRGEGATLNNVSQIFKARGDYDKALDLLKQSLAIQREIGDRRGEGTTINNISQIYHARGDYDKALDLLKQSLTIQQKIGDRSGEGATLNNISFIFKARGDYDKALEFLKQSLAIQQEIGDRSGEGTTLNNISQIFQARGDYDKALEFLKQSLAIHQEIGDRAGLCPTLFNIGHIHWQNEEPQEAVSAWVKVYGIAKEIGHAQALQALEDLARERGGDGLEYWEQLARQADGE